MLVDIGYSYNMHSPLYEKFRDGDLLHEIYRYDISGEELYNIINTTKGDLTVKLIQNENR